MAEDGVSCFYCKRDMSLVKERGRWVHAGYCRKGYWSGEQKLARRLRFQRRTIGVRLRLVMTKRMMQQSRKLLAVWLLPLPSPTHLSLSSCSTHLEHQKWNSSCPNMPSYYQMTKYCGQNLKSHSWMLKSGGQNLQSHSQMLKSRGQNLQSHSRMLKSRGRNLASHSRTPKSWDPPCVRTYVGARKATLPEGGIVRAPDGDLGCCVRSNSRS